MDEIDTGALAERLAGDPVLSDFLAPLPVLAGPEDDVEATFARLAERVGGSDVPARVLFRLSGGDSGRAWSLELGPDRPAVASGPVHRPDLEVLVDEDTWRRLVAGTDSPLEAFGRGELRVRGDVRLARHLVRLWRRS